MIYGYIRVSTQEQKEDRQLLALSEAGIKMKNIFMEQLLVKSLFRHN